MFTPAERDALRAALLDRACASGSIPGSRTASTNCRSI
jgi:hypothetical protein